MYGRGRGAVSRTIGNLTLQVKDDEGRSLIAQNEAPTGPPPIYPPLDLPPKPLEATKSIDTLIRRKRELDKLWRDSPYYDRTSSKDKKQRSSSSSTTTTAPNNRNNNGKKTALLQLETILTLDSHYFPEELITDTQQKSIAAATQGQQAAYWNKHKEQQKRAKLISDEMAELDRLAAKEKTSPNGGIDIDDGIGGNELDQSPFGFLGSPVPSIPGSQRVVIEEYEDDEYIGKNGSGGGTGDGEKRRRQAAAAAAAEQQQQQVAALADDDYFDEDDDYMQAEQVDDDEEYGDEDDGDAEAWFY